jgi:hypothetical protein
MRARTSDLGGIEAKHSAAPSDDDEGLIEAPETFEDYEEFAGETDATPDDRRRDPLRKSW